MTNTTDVDPLACNRLLGGDLIVWRPKPLLTYFEQLLFCAAGDDGFRGFQFQSQLVHRAIIRSFGIPRFMFGE